MTATAQDILAITEYPRNGANEFYRHWCNRRFIYSDGVKDLAEAAGCFWLLDIIATEIAPKFLNDGNAPNAAIKVKCQDRRGEVSAHFTDDSTEFARCLDFMDLPDGEFSLCLGYGDETTASLILWSEY